LTTIRRTPLCIAAKVGRKAKRLAGDDVNKPSRDELVFVASVLAEAQLCEGSYFVLTTNNPTQQSSEK